MSTYHSLEKRGCVSDFDGTVTDVQREAETYWQAYFELLSQKLNIPEVRVREEVEQAKTEILAHPALHGWEVGGYIVAPATADPYLLSTAAGKIAIKRLIEGTPLPALQDLPLEPLFQEVFAACYKKAGVAFRPNAAEYLKLLNATTDFSLVTNSDTAAVQQKLTHLLGDRAQSYRVIGNAKKYKVDPNWLLTPLSVTPPGFPRQVFLRRPNYYQVLQDLPNVQTVIGDVYELDLALPEHLGMQTILITSSNTPSWEGEHYLGETNGFATPSLAHAALGVQGMPGEGTR